MRTATAAHNKKEGGARRIIKNVEMNAEYHRHFPVAGWTDVVVAANIRRRRLTPKWSRARNVESSLRRAARRAARRKRRKRQPGAISWVGIDDASRR